MRMKHVIINGCFDCFHSGHQHLLDKAFDMSRKWVIILLNDDFSIEQLKGRKPIDSYEVRKAKIHEYCKKNHSCYGPPYYQIHDFCTETELSVLMDRFAPDIILKGNDRPDVREITGSDKWPVCIIPRIKDKNNNDISTTRIIKEGKHEEEINTK